MGQDHKSSMGLVDMGCFVMQWIHLAQDMVSGRLL